MTYLLEWPIPEHWLWDAERDTEHTFHLLLEGMQNTTTQHNRILFRNKTKGLKAMKKWEES